MRRILSDQDGVAAIEFAMIAPILLGLAMGAVEFGSILYTYASAEFAANDVTRQLATNRITPAQAQSAISPRLPNWAQGNATVRVNASSSTPSSNIYTVVVTLPLVNATPSTFLSSFYSSRSMNVTVAMQQEPTS